MQTINVKLKNRSYPIYIGQDILHLFSLVSKHIASGKLMLVSDDHVAPLHVTNLKQMLSTNKIEANIHTCVVGEEAKSVANWQSLIDEMVSNKLGRDSTLVAVGGGVVGDLTGFAAASFMRGIRVIQIPTTLLSQLDSSVGGKTAINHPAGKNLIGAFHQPAAVIIDTRTLDTLDDRNYFAGFAEAVKIALVADANLFTTLESNVEKFLARDHEFLVEMISHCCELKAEIVAEDEFELGRRSLLNFGHSFGHALEKIGGYSRWLHGEAIALGMDIAVKLSRHVHQLDDDIVKRSITLLKSIGLPVELPGDIQAETLALAMLGDKKSRAGKIRLVLLTALGQGVLSDPMELNELRGLLKETGIG